MERPFCVVTSLPSQRYLDIVDRNLVVKTPGYVKPPPPKPKKPEPKKEEKKEEKPVVEEPVVHQAEPIEVAFDPDSPS